MVLLQAGMQEVQMRVTWATRMVRDTENPSFREASCCRVDVVNGAAGLRLVGLVTRDFTEYSAPMQSVKKALASASVLNR